MSDRIDADESSEEEELYTDAITSHTIATDSTTTEICLPPVGPITSRVEEPSIVSQTESQFSPSMPYLEETFQSDNTSTEDSVCTSHSNNFDDTQHESQISLLVPKFLDEILGVPKENHTEDMDKSILLEQ